MNRTFLFLRAAFAEIGLFGFGIASLERQMDQILDVVQCHVQFKVSIMWSCWWWIWMISRTPELNESHVSMFAVPPCWD